MSNKIILGLKKPDDNSKTIVMDIDRHLENKLTISQMYYISQFGLTYPPERKNVTALIDLALDKNVKQVFVYVAEASDTATFIKSPKDPASNWLVTECSRFIPEKGLINLAVIVVGDDKADKIHGGNQAYLLTLNCPELTIRNVSHMGSAVRNV